jgi:hypothetical protein
VGLGAATGAAEGSIFGSNLQNITPDLTKGLREYNKEKR